MTKSSLVASESLAPLAAAADEMSDDLRTMKALRLMLESRLITPPEYARRLESFQKRLDNGSQAEGGNAEETA